MFAIYCPLLWQSVNWKNRKYFDRNDIQIANTYFLCWQWDVQRKVERKSMCETKHLFISFHSLIQFIGISSKMKRNKPAQLIDYSKFSLMIDFKICSVFFISEFYWAENTESNDSSITYTFSPVFRCLKLMCWSPK